MSISIFICYGLGLLREWGCLIVLIVDKVLLFIECFNIGSFEFLFSSFFLVIEIFLDWFDIWIWRIFFVLFGLFLGINDWILLFVLWFGLNIVDSLLLFVLVGLYVL